MSPSTAAPAALAFSEGGKLLTKGTATATPPAAPAHPDAISHVLLLVSTGVSLMGILGKHRYCWVNRELERSENGYFKVGDCLDRAPRRAILRHHHSNKEHTMGMMQEFREFAVKGNVIDLAVGVIIGGAFGKIVDSVVSDLIMPVVGLVFGKLDFSNLFVVLGSVPPGTAMTLDALKKAGVPVFAYGNFLTVAVNFIILAFIIFMMIKQINRLKREAPAPAPEAPAAPAEDIVLLREIRDSLKK